MASTGTVPKDGGTYLAQKPANQSGGLHGTKIFLSGMSYPTTDEAKIFCYPFPNKREDSNSTARLCGVLMADHRRVEPQSRRRGPGYSCLALELNLVSGLFTSCIFLGLTSAKERSQDGKRQAVLLGSSRKEVYGRLAHFRDSSFLVPQSGQELFLPFHCTCAVTSRLLGCVTEPGEKPCGRHW